MYSDIQIWRQYIYIVICSVWRRITCCEGIQLYKRKICKGSSHAEVSEGDENRSACDRNKLNGVHILCTCRAGILNFPTWLMLQLVLRLMAWRVVTWEAKKNATWLNVWFGIFKNSPESLWKTCSGETLQWSSFWIFRKYWLRANLTVVEAWNWQSSS